MKWTLFTIISLPLLIIIFKDVSQMMHNNPSSDSQEETSKDDDEDEDDTKEISPSHHPPPFKKKIQSLVRSLFSSHCVIILMYVCVGERSIFNRLLHSRWIRRRTSV